MYILAINPGSTSTKIAVYQERNLMFKNSLEHSNEELAKYPNIASQYEMRKAAILESVKNSGFDIVQLDAVVGRGGILPPVKSGAYEVNAAMVDVLLNRPAVDHASNLGALISFDIANGLNKPAYIYDSVAVDELADVARITGMAEIERKSFSHCLNMRAAAMKTAEELGKPYKELNLVVVHLGGGITLSVHQHGQMVDIVSDDEGPFSPERSGRLPIKDFIKVCYAQEQPVLSKKIRGAGGLVSLLGTNNAQEVEAMIGQGNEKAKLVYAAMGYQIAKSIGEMAVVVDGNVDAIVITGGIAYSKIMTEYIRKKVKFIAPVHILPGENELESLALGVLRVLKGEEEAHDFRE